MSITHNETGYHFTLGARSFGPYPTWEQAAEAQFDAERGQQPDLVRATLEYVVGDLPADIPLDETVLSITDELDGLLSRRDQNNIEEDLIDLATEGMPPRIAYKRVLSSANDGSGWDRYDRGDVGLDLGDDGGCLCLGRETHDLDLAGIAQLLDLRDILTDKRVYAKLIAMYNQETAAPTTEYSPWDDLLTAGDA